MNPNDDRDAYRVYVDYGEHAPSERTIENPQIIPTHPLLAHMFGEIRIAPVEHWCAPCEEPWPCKAALRLERDTAEREAIRRGDLLRQHGIPTDGLDPFHPDAETPRGRALLECGREILRARAERSKQIAQHALNLLAWHPACHAECVGNNHIETMAIDPCGRTHEEEATYLTYVLRRGYNVGYQSHVALPPEKQAAALADYGTRLFQTSLRGGEMRPSSVEEGIEDGAAIVVLAVRFYSAAPLDTLRGWVAEAEARELTKASGA